MRHVVNLRFIVVTLLMTTGWVTSSPVRAGALEDTVATAVAELKPSLQSTSTLSLGTFVFRDLDVGSPLLEWVRLQITKSLVEAKSCTVVEQDRARLDDVMTKVKRFEGELFDPGAPELLGALRKVDFVLTGDGLDKPESVHVTLRLISTTTLQAVKQVVLTIDKSSVPAAISTRPPVNPRIAEAIQYRKETTTTAGGAGLKVFVIPDKVSSRAYREGEDVVLRVWANQDCYVRLFYTDSKGRTFQIFPNSFHKDYRIEANKALIIGEKESPFTFTVSPPFGVEMMTVVAATEPFELPTTAEEPQVGAKGGILPTRASLKQILERFRNEAASRGGPGKAWVDQSCTIFTAQE